MLAPPMPSPPALVHRVEVGLASDVRQPQAVAVERDAGDDAVHHARGIGLVDRAEAQLVHDRDRAGAHRDDVAHDAADAGRGALERLDVRRVVVRLHLERDGPALADVDDAGVLAHAHHEVLLHRGRDLLAELAEVDLRRLVGAVLRPHDGVHRQLARGGAAAEDLADACVLVALEAESRVRLLLLRRRGGVRDGVDDVLDRGVGHAGTPGCWAVAGMEQVYRPARGVRPGSPRRERPARRVGFPSQL
jgi:hypothetical protein